MSTLLPPGETLRRAVEWIAEERRQHPARHKLLVVEEAAMRFNLGPSQEEWLLQMLAKSPPDEER
jgi:hypothetical protein